MYILGYYLEVLLMLGLFCKNPLNAVLRGVTCTNIDPSVDYVKASMIPVLKKFVLDDEDLDLKITKRGLYLLLCLVIYIQGIPLCTA